MKGCEQFPAHEVVACDFDGTIACQDTCDMVLEAFASGDWRRVGQDYEEGKISHREMNRRFVQMLKVTPAELASFIKNNVRVREGFYEFISSCRKRGLMPLIISGGWDFNIKTILSDLKVVFPKSTDELCSMDEDCLPAICNHLEYDGDSASWKITFPFTDGKTATPDKEAVVNLLRCSGVKNIIVVGDGLSDRDMAESADIVFSRDMLTGYCRNHGIESTEYDQFKDIAKIIEEMKAGVVRVLSLPSYHPYMTRFDDGRNVVFANPGSNTFSEPDKCTPDYFENQVPSDKYDVVHIHFEYHLIEADRLEKLLEYFKRKNKPIVWTCHDRRSLTGESPDGRHEQLLNKYADRITTLTEGSSRWLKVNFGNPDDKIKVMPLGYMAHPAVVRGILRETVKERHLFTMLIGDFRKSKEFVRSIEDFLACKGISPDARLQVIYRPPDPNAAEPAVREKLTRFQELIKKPGIVPCCRDKFSDVEMTRLFASSHAIVLPYLWGTHSGQLELARDCGCHVIVPDVGYYGEQWDSIRTWPSSGEWDEEQSDNYKNALSEVDGLSPLNPAGYSRIEQFRREIMHPHVELYKNLLSEKRR